MGTLPENSHSENCSNFASLSAAPTDYSLLTITVIVVTATKMLLPSLGRGYPNKFLIRDY
jgi:hypothetical protein